MRDALLTERRVCAFFSGIECPRAAWQRVVQAAWDLWQLEPGVRFVCAATCLYMYSKPVLFHGIPFHLLRGIGWAIEAITFDLYQGLF